MRRAGPKNRLSAIFQNIFLMKTVSFIQRNAHVHGIGNGFPARTLFSYNDNPAGFTPFLMLECGGPTVFDPINEPVVGYGPLVMNTPRANPQACTDFQSGKMGRL